MALFFTLHATMSFMVFPGRKRKIMRWHFIIILNYFPLSWQVLGHGGMSGFYRAPCGCFLYSIEAVVRKRMVSCYDF